MVMKYTRSELIRAVRIERMELQQELLGMTKRIRQIEARIVELDKADGMLEGEQ